MTETDVWRRIQSHHHLAADTATSPVCSNSGLRPVSRSGFLTWSLDGTAVLYISRAEAGQVDVVILGLHSESSAPRKLATVPDYSRGYTASGTLQWRGNRAVAGPIHARWLSPDGRYLLSGTQGRRLLGRLGSDDAV